MQRKESLCFTWSERDIENWYINGFSSNRSQEKQNTIKKKRRKTINTLSYLSCYFFFLLFYHFCCLYLSCYELLEKLIRLNWHNQVRGTLSTFVKLPPSPPHLPVGAALCDDDNIGHGYVLLNTDFPVQCVPSKHPHFSHFFSLFTLCLLWILLTSEHNFAGGVGVNCETGITHTQTLWRTLLTQFNTTINLREIPPHDYS